VQTLPHSPPKRNGSDLSACNAQAGKAKELRQRIDDSLDGLAKAVDDVRASETFRQFLEVQARFHKYSWHNSLLTCMQRPQATRVAGYKTWQSLGRQVRKGEHGIMIFAPCPWKREVERDDGETETEQGIYFRVSWLGVQVESLRPILCRTSCHRHHAAII